MSDNDDGFVGVDTQGQGPTSATTATNLPDTAPVQDGLRQSSLLLPGVGMHQQHMGCSMGCTHSSFMEGCCGISGQKEESTYETRDEEDSSWKEEGEGYWGENGTEGVGGKTQFSGLIEETTAVQCEDCQKWRKVPRSFAEVLPDSWVCSKNTWDVAFADCSVGEERFVEADDLSYGDILQKFLPKGGKEGDSLHRRLSESAAWLEERLTTLKLAEKRQPDKTLSFVSYSDLIKELCPDTITDKGIRFLALMGKHIKNFNPLIYGAIFHYLDNHNCPNGLMPVFALVLMMLSDFKLSFKAAHELVCDFVREQHRVNGKKKDFANFIWLQMSGWSDKENDTAEKIIGGKHKASSSVTFPLPLTSTSPLFPPQLSRNEGPLQVFGGERGLQVSDEGF